MGRCNIANLPIPANIRLVVLGDRNVGKSALVVRFLTKRYIGEYASGTELTYHKEVNIAGNRITAEICDALIKKDSQNYFRKLSGNTEACLLVYNVCSRTSFEYACKLAQEVKTCRLKTSAGSDVPMVLVGNKSDLGHFRQVTKIEGESFAKTINMCHFVETSAAESFSDVERAFQLVFQLIRNNAHRSSPTPSVTSARIHRKNSWSQVAQLIREHVRKQHNASNQNLNLNHSEKDLIISCNDDLICDKNNNNSTKGILRKRRMRKNSALGLTPNSFPLVERLKSRCLSLSTLNENSQIDPSQPNGVKNKKYHPYSSVGKLAMNDSRKNSDNESQASVMKMSLSSDETLELSGFSTPDEDAFLPEDPNHTSCKFLKPTPLQSFAVLKKSNGVVQKPSMNKKNLQICIYSDDDLNKIDDRTLKEYRENVPPKSAPAFHTSSNKFSFFSSGVVEDHSFLSTSPRRSNPAFNENLTKSPKDEKRNLGHSFLKNLFKGGTFTNRTFGSSQNLNLPPNTARSDVFMSVPAEAMRSTLASIAEDKLSSMTACKQTHPRASSSSLSSVLSNDLDVDNMDSCFSDPASPISMKTSSIRNKLPSFRGAMEGLMMRKRKQSTGGDINAHNKERFFF